MHKEFFAFALIHDSAEIVEVLARGLEPDYRNTHKLHPERVHPTRLRREPGIGFIGKQVDDALKARIGDPIQLLGAYQTRGAKVIVEPEEVADSVKHTLFYPAICRGERRSKALGASWFRPNDFAW